MRVGTNAISFVCQVDGPANDDGAALFLDSFDPDGGANQDKVT